MEHELIDDNCRAMAVPARSLNMSVRGRFARPRARPTGGTPLANRPEVGVDRRGVPLQSAHSPKASMQRERTQRIALGLLLLASFFLVLKLAAPLWMGLAFGTIGALSL